MKELVKVWLEEAHRLKELKPEMNIMSLHGQLEEVHRKFLTPEFIFISSNLLLEEAHRLKVLTPDINYHTRNRI